ncbi:MAG: ABC transporter substrate-binding protein [Gemmobacter sp.]
MTMLRTFAASAALALGLSPAAQAVDLEFYFPVAIGGPATQIIDELVADYTAVTPGVKISAIYAGSYPDTLARAITASRGGNPPQLAILDAPDLFTLLDEELILPWDDFLTEEEMKTWVGGFFPAFMQNSQTEGKTWGIPFQRSTPVIYWNKDAFKAAGLDPEVGPDTWDEMVEMGKKLTLRDASGKVTQWGVRIPAQSLWLPSGLVAANGGEMSSEDGTQAYFNTPETIGAVEFLAALSREHGVMEPGVIDWGATPRAFLDGQAAIIWTTTGNLTNIRKNATFPFGVGMLPAKVRRGAPTGGGNFYLFKGASEEQLAEAVKFVKWATAPAQAAKWSIATGYVAPRPEVWETEVMKEYVKEVPGAVVARDQLQYTIRQFSTYDVLQVSKAFNDNVAAVLNGETWAALALADAPAAADAILAAYRK